MNRSLSISLPPHMKSWVERQVSRKLYDSPEEVVLAALRKEQLHEAREQIDAILLESLNSSESTPMTKRDWQRIRSEGIRHFRSRQKK